MSVLVLSGFHRKGTIKEGNGEKENVKKVLKIETHCQYFTGYCRYEICFPERTRGMAKGVSPNGKT